MSMFHDSRDAHYRAPGGALPCWTRVTLRLRADEATGPVLLRIWWDNRASLVDMKRGALGLYEAAVDMPGSPGVLWYFFLVQCADGLRCYGNAADGMGGEGRESVHEPPGYQITLYDPAYDTPRWMREGLIYQIMVDRFCASTPVKEKPAPAGGHFHEDWYEPPEVLPQDTQKEIEYDFYGGDLKGVMEKLPYLQSLGVTALYFNPIFRARSNHKYDTGDYEAVDPSFGDEADFKALCAAAKKRNISILLDGVFSHTGADSRYFNRYGHYDSVGAYQSQSSPYASWYRFFHFPDAYECWWNFRTLPNVNEMDGKYLDFIIRGEEAVCAKWIKDGASGWRLDVADELPMDFIRALRARVKAEDPRSAVLGEVWENASNKMAYGQMRSYCLGDTLDSCMNYPLRQALTDFLLGGIDAGQAARRIDYLGECYPKCFFYSLMNLLGSHDRPRVIDVLAGLSDLEPPYPQRHARTLTKAQYDLGARRFEAAWRFVCALPGMPGLYYGDEAGMTGMTDPFCRAAYPWGREDKALQEKVARIGRERMASPALKTGSWSLAAPTPDVLTVVRKIENGRDAFGEPAPNERVLCALNRANAPATIACPGDPGRQLTLEPVSCVTVKI